MSKTTIREKRPEPRTRTDANRARVMDAAERLLRQDGEDFSMRALASEAGVSFATPFNLFGNKIAVAQALSARRILQMTERFIGEPQPVGAVDRVLAAVTIAVDVLLEDPEVSRAVMGSLGAPTGAPGAVAADSRAFWSTALEGGSGIDPHRAETAHLAYHLALMFRGCLSFWAAGEIKDADLKATAHSGSAAVLLGFASSEQVPFLLGLFNPRP